MSKEMSSLSQTLEDKEYVEQNLETWMVWCKIKIVTTDATRRLEQTKIISWIHDDEFIVISKWWTLN